MRNDGTGEMAEALKEEMECCGCGATDVLASRQVGNKQGLQEQKSREIGDELQRFKIPKGEFKPSDLTPGCSFSLSLVNLDGSYLIMITSTFVKPQPATPQYPIYMYSVPASGFKKLGFERECVLHTDKHWNTSRSRNPRRNM